MAIKKYKKGEVVKRGDDRPYSYKDMAKDKAHMSSDKLRKDKGSRALSEAPGRYYEHIPNRNPIYKAEREKGGYGENVSVTSRGRDVERIKDRSDITEGQTGGRYEGTGHERQIGMVVSEDTGRLKGLKYTKAGKGAKGIKKPKKQNRTYFNNSYSEGE